MAGRSSTEPPRRSLVAAVSRLTPTERLAGVGALVCIASLVLPWYRVSAGGGLERTGIGAFGFAEAALVLTEAAALFLLWQVGQGRRPALPLKIGTMLVLAGSWSALLVVYLMFDRPHLDLNGFSSGYSLGYGIFIALAGAALIVLAGLRERALKRTPLERRG